MLSIPSPDSVFILLVSIFISKTHNYSESYLIAANRFALVYTIMSRWSSLLTLLVHAHNYVNDMYHICTYLHLQHCVSALQC